MHRIGPNVWAAMKFPKGTLVVQDIYGEAVFKVVGHRHGQACLMARGADRNLYHYADIRDLTFVGVEPKQEVAPCI